MRLTTITVTLTLAALASIPPLDASQATPCSGMATDSIIGARPEGSNLGPGARDDSPRTTVSGTVGDEASQVALAPLVNYPAPAYAEAAVDADGGFQLVCDVPAPMLCELKVFEGRRRATSIPLYLAPGQSLRVRLAGGDSVFEGEGARENSRVYDCVIELQKHLRLHNPEADPQKTAAFLEVFEKLLSSGSEGERPSQAFRTLMMKVARREVDLSRMRALEKTGGEAYRSFLQELLERPPTTAAFASVRDWHHGLDHLTQQFCAFGLLERTTAPDECRVQWVGDPYLRSGLAVYLMNREINCKRWFRDPLRPRMLPLVKYLVGERDQEEWARLLTRLDEMEEDFAHLAVGKEAPAFQLEDIDGQIVSLADFRGKFVVLDVWNIYCGPCVAQIPHIKRIESELEPAGIAFVSVSSDSQADKSRWREFVRQREMAGTQLIVDEGARSRFLRDYRIKGFPTFCVIDPDGKIADPFFLWPENEGFVPGLMEIRESHSRARREAGR